MTAAAATRTPGPLSAATTCLAQSRAADATGCGCAPRPPAAPAPGCCSPPLSAPLVASLATAAGCGGGDAWASCCGGPLSGSAPGGMAWAKGQPCDLEHCPRSQWRQISWALDVASFTCWNWHLLPLVHVPHWKNLRREWMIAETA